MAAVNCLGQGEYAARVIRRRTKLGPATTMGELPNLEAGTWSRQQQQTTQATLTIGLGAIGCQQVLGIAQPWRDEVELYRGDDVVWAGPITDVAQDPDQQTATVTAKDLSAWWDFRLMLQNFSFKQTDLAMVFQAYMAYAFALDDPGIVIDAQPSGVLGDVVLAASDAKTLTSALGELATTAVDWTVAGRRFYLGAIGRLPYRLVDESFAVSPKTRRSGVGQVNDAYVRSNGKLGHFGGPDPQDGVLLQGVRDQQTASSTETLDEAARSWWDRSSEPSLYVDGDAMLDPSCPVDIQTLVPGVIVPVDLDGSGVVPVGNDQRLEHVTVNFGGQGGTAETVAVGLQPPGTTTRQGF